MRMNWFPFSSVIFPVYPPASIPQVIGMYGWNVFTISGFSNACIFLLVLGKYVNFYFISEFLILRGF